MRARRNPEEAFLERTEEEWRALGVPERYYSRYGVLPVLGWFKLAKLRALRPHEVAQLERIATGMVPHPRIDMGRALQLLREHDGVGQCVLPEVCATGRLGCDCPEDGRGRRPR